MPDNTTTTDHRSANIDVMRRLLDEAGPDGLTAEAAAEFDRAEAAVRAVDDMATRQRAIDDSMGRLGGVLPDVDGDGQPASQPVVTRGRTVGAVPPVAFTRDQLGELHDALMGHRSAGVVAETRAVTAGSAPMAGQPGYGPVATVRRDPARIAELIPTQAVEHPQVTYYRASGGADAAATVAEAAAKPESNPGWAAVTVPVRKIAHWVSVSSEALADYANFESLVTGEMISGLVNVESAQVLAGAGTGTDVLGLLNQSGILTYTPGAAEPRLFSLLRGVTLLRTGAAFAEPDVIVVHPTDWETIRKMAATTGELLVSPSPTTDSPNTLWGVRVVVTARITAGVALVANLALGAVLFSREAPSLFVDPYGLSTSNLVRFVAEERIAVGTPQPAAICKITFNGAT